MATLPLETLTERGVAQVIQATTPEGIPVVVVIIANAVYENGVVLPKAV